MLHCFEKDFKTDALTNFEVNPTYGLGDIVSASLQPNHHHLKPNYAQISHVQIWSYSCAEMHQSLNKSPK